MNRERILIAIPSYQAAATLGAVLDSCAPIAQQAGARILVVDDGSTDGTSRVAKEHGADVARHTVNRGKGGALKTAHSVAMAGDYDAVVSLDADGQHLPDNVTILLDHWRSSRADLVIGSRSHLFDQMVGRRKMANRFSARSISFAARTPISDTQSGFRVYDRNFIQKVRFVSEGFAAESEMLVIAARLGLSISEVPIELGFVDGVQTSHYLAVRDTLRIAGRVALTTLQLQLGNDRRG